MKQIKGVISILCVISLMLGLAVPITAAAKEGTEKIELLDTASLYYNGSERASFHDLSTENTEAVEYFQKNSALTASPNGGYAFIQFRLTEEQRSVTSAEVVKVEFSCYATESFGLKTKFGEKQYTATDDFSDYGASWLEDTKHGGFTNVTGISAERSSSETAVIGGKTYNKYTADLTPMFQDMQQCSDTVTIAVTSSNTLQSIAAFGTEYAPGLTITYGQKTPVTSLKAVYEHNGETIAEFNLLSDEAYIGDSYTYISPNYIKGSDDRYYAVGVYSRTNRKSTTVEDSDHGGINKALKKEVILTDDTVIEYEVSETDVTYYGEWENILSESAGVDFAVGRYYASGGKMYSLNGIKEFYTVPETGLYRITLTGGGKNSGTEIFKNKDDADEASAYGGGAAILGIKKESGYESDYYGLYASNTALLTAGDRLAVKNYTGNDLVDYVAVSKIDLEIEGKGMLSIGETFGYTLPTVNDITGKDLTAENLTVSYTSSNPSVVSVDRSTGAARAAAKGSADIIAEITINGEVIESKKTVTVDFYTVISDVSGDSTDIDISDLVINDNVTGYSVTTADSEGNIVDRYQTDMVALSEATTEVYADEDAYVIYPEYSDSNRLEAVSTVHKSAGEAIDSKEDMLVWDSLSGMRPVSLKTREAESKIITVDTKGAASVEISPIYTYNYTASDEFYTADDMTLNGFFADGDYSFEITKAPKKVYGCIYDLYINGSMIGNNVNEKAIGRTMSESDLTYTVKDITVSGGTITLQKREFYSFSGRKRVEDEDKAVSKIVVKREPTISNRKQKVYILGDSLVAIYYGDLEIDPASSSVITKKEVGTGRTGWGQVIYNYFTEDVEVINLANSGQWATGLQETAFSCIMQSARRGDYMILESGWNDVVYSNKFEMRKAVVEMTEICEEKGIVPVLVSPNSSSSTYKNGANTQYASTMRGAADEMMAVYQDVRKVDLASLSYNFLTDTYSGDTTKIDRNINLDYAGTSTVSGEHGDGLHLSYLGAMKYAELVAQSMSDQNVPFINKTFSYEITDYEGNEFKMQIK